MKVITAVFFMAVTVTVLAVATLVQLLIVLLPYLAIAVVVALVLRARRGARSSTPAPRCPVRVAPPAVPGGWVMVPVWVAATPGPQIIDAEIRPGRD